MTEARVRSMVPFMGWVFCLVLTGCAVTRPLPGPPLIRDAERLNRRGVVDTDQQRFQAAEASFADAYRLYGSVEEFGGMVTVLVNSSRLYRIRGEVDKAAQAAARAGEMAHRVPHLAAEVWFELAKIRLLQGDTDGAVTWSDKALHASTDANRAMILNLQADLFRLRGNLPRCVDLTGEALKVSRTAADRHAEADALRILADCQLAGNQPAAAAEAYGAALQIHKSLAQPRQIHADLEGLSASMERQGDRCAAGDYLLRAADLAIARGDIPAASAHLGRATELCGDGDRGAAIRARMERLQNRGVGGTSP